MYILVLYKYFVVFPPFFHFPSSSSLACPPRFVQRIMLISHIPVQEGYAWPRMPDCTENTSANGICAFSKLTHGAAHWRGVTDVRQNFNCSPRVDLPALWGTAQEGHIVSCVGGGGGDRNPTPQLRVPDVSRYIVILQRNFKRF